jgi:hypothetical protein
MHHVIAYLNCSDNVSPKYLIMHTQFQTYYVVQVQHANGDQGDLVFVMSMHADVWQQACERVGPHVTILHVRELLS